MGWATVLMPAPASEEGLAIFACQSQYFAVLFPAQSIKVQGLVAASHRADQPAELPPEPKRPEPPKKSSSQPLSTALVVVVQHPRTAVAKVSFGPGSGSGSMQERGSPPKRSRGSFPHVDLHLGWQDR